MPLFVFIVFGLLVGSFINVLADRLARGEDALWGRSRCDHCNKPLRWFELIPVLSFILQRGRCLRCRKRISIQYPIVEIASAFLFGSISIWYPPIPMLPNVYIVNVLTLLLLAGAFLVIIVSDAKYQIIPDSMVIVSLVGSMIWIYRTTAPIYWIQHVATGVGCVILFFSLWLVTRGRGIGLGDVKLVGVIGMLLGFPLAIFALYGAFLTGAGVGVILMITGHKTLKSKIAFGPFLLVGMVSAIIFGPTLLGVWKSIL